MDKRSLYLKLQKLGACGNNAIPEGLNLDEMARTIRQHQHENTERAEEMDLLEFNLDIVLQGFERVEKHVFRNHSLEDTLSEIEDTFKSYPKREPKPKADVPNQNRVPLVRRRDSATSPVAPASSGLGTPATIAEATDGVDSIEQIDGSTLQRDLQPSEIECLFDEGQLPLGPQQSSIELNARGLTFEQLDAEIQAPRAVENAEFVEDFLVMPPIDDATLDGDQQPLAPQQVSIDLTPRQLLYEQLDVERRAPMPVEDGDFGENILNLPPMAIDVGVGTVTFDGHAAEESVTLLDPAGDPEPSSLPAPDALAPPVIEPVRPTVRGRRRRPRRVRRSDDSDYAAPPRIPRLPTTVEIESDLLEGIRRQVFDNLNARSSVVAMETPNNAVEPDSYHRRSTGDVANVRNDGIATAPRLPPVIGDFDITHEAITPHVETNDAFVPHVNAIEAIVPQIVIDADDVPMPNVSDAFPMPLRPTTPPPHPPAALLDTTTFNQAQPPLSPMVLLCPLSQQLMSTPLPVPPQREPSPVGDSNAAQRAQRSGNVDNGTLQYAEVLLQVPDTPMRMLYTKRCSVSLESMADDRRAEEQATRTSASRLVRAMRSSNVPLRAGPLLRSVTASRTAELPTNSVSVRQAFQTICNMHDKQYLDVHTDGDSSTFDEVLL